MVNLPDVTVPNVPGHVDEAIGRQFDNTQGGGLVDGYQDYAATVWSPVTDSAGDATETVRTTVDSTVEEARNIGPNWLDEAAIGGSALLIVLVLAVVFGPYAEIGASLTD